MTTDAHHEENDPATRSFERALLDASLTCAEPRERAEQIYEFSLCEPSVCAALIERAERCGRWRTAREGHFERNPYADVDEHWEPDTVQSFAELGLEQAWQRVVERRLAPMIQRLWRTFTVKRVTTPYVLRYSPDVIASMALHHDLETVALVAYLNDDFDGGGTLFPRWNFSTAGIGTGSAIVYPGGVSHEHLALPVTRGTRYVLCASFF